MTDIDKLIDGLQLNIDCIGTSKITRQEALDHLNNTISFLRNLQQSGNEELIGYLKSLKANSHKLIILSECNSIKTEDALSILDQAITALSAPTVQEKPFDVIEYIKSKGQVEDTRGNIWELSTEDGELWMADGLMRFEEGVQVFVDNLFNGKLKPYTKPEPDLEDGWYLLDINGAKSAHYFVNGKFYSHTEIEHAVVTDITNDGLNTIKVVSRLIEATELTGNE